MPPYFETVKSFADVPIADKGVETQSFLKASDGLVQLFDLLGSGVFGFVQADIRGNIQGLRSRYASGTLESLVEHEHQECACSATQMQKHGTPYLVRLIRGLAFTCKALQNMQADTSSELYPCFKRSYDEVLGHHHSFVIRSIVSVAIRAVPRRSDFYRSIAQGGSVEKLDEELAKWLVGLDGIVKRMCTFLEKGGYGKV